MIRIVAGVEGHLPELVDLDVVATESSERRQHIAGWLAHGQCHVALLDERPAGYVALTHNFFHSPFVEMLIVAPGARRRGVGGALLRHCIAGFADDGKLWTSTNQSNAPMRALLDGHGFIRSGIVHHLDADDPELIYLHRRPRHG